MTKAESILIVVDPGAERQPAMERGMLLAQRMGMRVDLFACDYDAQLVSGLFLNPDKLKEAKAAYLERNSQLLRELAEPYIEQGIDVTTLVAWDRPLYEGIVRQALHSDARFVVKDMHYHSMLSRVLFTHTDWHLIRSCPTPLWLVRADRDYTQPEILVAVDPLHEHDKPASLDDRLVSEAFEIGDAMKGPVHIAHVFNPYLDPADPDLLEKVHRDALMVLAEKQQIPKDRVHMHAGNAVDVLPRISQDIAADLVVMGAISRSRLENAIVGSTAENVLESLGCDVLVLKPQGFISPVTFQTAPKGAVFAR